MSAIPFVDDVLDPDVDVLQLADVAKLQKIVVTKVHQQLRDRQLLAIRRDGVVAVPSLFFESSGEIARMLPGLLAVLHDGGFSPEETLRWLFAADDSLRPIDGRPARPVDALHGHEAREIVRRAQAMAF